MKEKLGVCSACWPTLERIQKANVSYCAATSVTLIITRKYIMVDHNQFAIAIDVKILNRLLTCSASYSQVSKCIT